MDVVDEIFDLGPYVTIGSSQNAYAWVFPGGVIVDMSNLAVHIVTDSPSNNKDRMLNILLNLTGAENMSILCNLDFPYSVPSKNDDMPRVSSISLGM